METTALVFAIIGCVTGAISLMIQFSSYFSTRPHLKIELDKSSHSYYFKAKDFDIKGNYRTNYSAVISLVISNKSSYPVTIDNIYIKSNKRTVKSYGNFNFQAQEILIDNGKAAMSLNPSSSINLPLRVEAFHAIFGSARFPFFDEMVCSNDLSKPITVTLIISTPRKVYRHKVKLYEYTHYHAQYQKLHNI